MEVPDYSINQLTVLHYKNETECVCKGLKARIGDGVYVAARWAPPTPSRDVSSSEAGIYKLPFWNYEVSTR